MALLYTFKKEQDTFILEVEQDSAYIVYYLSGNTEKTVLTSAILAGNPTLIPHDLDGEYKIHIEAENEIPIDVYFTAFDKLQNSIINDTNIIVCGATGGCTDLKSNCISNEGQTCLEHKSSFVKLLSFESLFIDSYGIDFPLIFTNYLNESVQSLTCKIQSKINLILQTECVVGIAKDTDSLFSFYVALYWAGMYFMEEDIAGDDVEQLEFVKTKFRYDAITQCLCGLCISMDTLKENYGKDTVYTEIYSFQFDGTEFDIDDVDIVTPEWLELHGTVENEMSLLSGKNIEYSLVGRVGFTISNNKDVYRFFDALGNDITDTVFDNVWDDTAKRQTYISKEYYVPSTIYYKFVNL